MYIKGFPKRGKCPCGGYYQDWHSHASDCIALGGDVDYSILECPKCGCEITKSTMVCPDPECRYLIKFAEVMGILNPALKGATEEYHKERNNDEKIRGRNRNKD